MSGVVIESTKPTSTTNWSKMRPAISAVTWKRIARKSSASSRSSVRLMAKLKKSSRAAPVRRWSLDGSSSSSARPRSMSLVGRLVAWKRKSSASAPLRIQRSGATATSRRRNSSKATRLRSRARPSPLVTASAFNRSSRAWRKAEGVASRWEQRLEEVRLAASRGFSLELSAREQPTAERLARGEELLRLKLTGDVDQCAGRRSRRHPLAPDTLDDLVVGARVPDDAGGAAQPSVPAGTSRWTWSGMLSLSSRSASALSWETSAFSGPTASHFSRISSYWELGKPGMR